MKEQLFDRVLDGAVRLPAPAAAEARLLDGFRLTPEYRKVFGERILSQEGGSALAEQAVQGLRAFLDLGEEEPVDTEKNRELLIDLIYTSVVLGYQSWEYFAYHFQDRSIAERLEFFPEARYTQYYSVLNDSRMFTLFDDKFETYEALKPYYKREMIPVRAREALPEFLDFYARYDSFIVKPISGSYGSGVQLVGRAVSEQSPEELFAGLIAEGPFVCEERVVSAESLCRIHPPSLNTLRVYTYHDLEGGVEPRIICALVKAGRDGALIDNGEAGGLVAAIDVQTGLVCTDGWDRKGGHYPAHPDSGFVFRGTAIENWEDCVRLSKELAGCYPTMRMIGWDIALSADRGWLVIEGNPRGMFYAGYQKATQKGQRRFFLEQFEWEKHTKQDGHAVFLPGSVFRKKVTALAGAAENITAFRRADRLPEGQIMTERNLVSQPAAGDPIYAWFEQGTIWYFTKARAPYLDSNPSAMFMNLSAIKTVDLSGVQTGHSLYFDFMFKGCRALQSLDLSGFDTSKANLMNSMFRECEALKELDLRGFNTGRVKKMQQMFAGCVSLEKVELTSFRTEGVVSMAGMFENCRSLRELDLSSFDSSLAEDLQRMFKGCASLLGIRGERIVAGEGAKSKDMFAGCDRLQPPVE